MKIKTFEDIDAWKKARELNKKIYTLFGNSRDFSFRDQIQRATMSISANIAEGFDRKTNKEFIHFLSIAKGSASEVRSFLYLALDIGYISEEEFRDLFLLTEEISKLLYGLMQYLRKFEEEKSLNS